MSGPGFFGPRRAPPPPPPRCTVFFYSWRCGHRQWVHCSGCDVAGGPSSHLGHPHVERQLPPPRHRCPTCEWPTERELELAPLMGEGLSVLARQSIAILRRENNHPDIIRTRIASDVEATMNPWRHEQSATDDMTPDQLRAHVAQRLERERQRLVDDRMWWQRFSQGLEPTLPAAANPPQQLSPTPAPPPQLPMNGWHNPPVQAAAPRPRQLLPMPVPQPQTLVNGWHNGPVQAAAPRGSSGGHRADGRVLGYQPNGVHINGPRQHHGGNGGRGFPGRGTRRGQHTRGPRGGPGRSQHNAQPRQPSQLRNGYVPEEEESDGQQR